MANHCESAGSRSGLRGNPAKVWDIVNVVFHDLKPAFQKLQRLNVSEENLLSDQGIERRHWRVAGLIPQRRSGLDD